MEPSTSTTAGQSILPASHFSDLEQLWQYYGRSKYSHGLPPRPTSLSPIAQSTPPPAPANDHHGVHWSDLSLDNLRALAMEIAGRIVSLRAEEGGGHSSTVVTRHRQTFEIFDYKSVNQTLHPPIESALLVGILDRLVAVHGCYMPSRESYLSGSRTEQLSSKTMEEWIVPFRELRDVELRKEKGAWEKRFKDALQKFRSSQSPAPAVITHDDIVNSIVDAVERHAVQADVFSNICLAALGIRWFGAGSEANRKIFTR